MKYTVKQVKNIGGRKFLKRRGKRIAMLFGLCIIWTVAVNFLIINPNIWVWIAPYVLVLFNVAWTYNKARNVFYEQARKNPKLLE